MAISSLSFNLGCMDQVQADIERSCVNITVDVDAKVIWLRRLGTSMAEIESWIGIVSGISRS